MKPPEKLREEILSAQHGFADEFGFELNGDYLADILKRIRTEKMEAYVRGRFGDYSPLELKFVSEVIDGPKPNPIPQKRGKSL